MTSHRFDGFTPISSDHIDGAKYHQLEHAMTVRFKNGYHYKVHGVSPEAYQEFMDAPSQGEHYYKIFKNDYHIERVK